MEIQWTERASERLREIFEYVAQDDIDTARSFVLRLIQRAETITDHPKAGRMVPEFEREDVRELVSGNYRIIYRLTDGPIYILTVRHCSRLLQEIGRGL